MSYIVNGKNNKMVQRILNIDVAFLSYASSRIKCVNTNNNTNIQTFNET